MGRPGDLVEVRAVASEISLAPRRRVVCRAVKTTREPAGRDVFRIIIGGDIQIGSRSVLGRRGLYRLPFGHRFNPFLGAHPTSLRRW